MPSLGRRPANRARLPEPCTLLRRRGTFHRVPAKKPGDQAFRVDDKIRVNLNRGKIEDTLRLLRFCLLALFPFALLCAAALAQTSVFTSPLPTGVRLDGVGETVELGSMPLNVVPARSGDKAVVVLGGWREQGIQVVDLKTRQVTQTLLQDGAFYGAAFSPMATRSTSPAATPICFWFTRGKMARRRLRVN